jgi:hypothetical protein
MGIRICGRGMTGRHSPFLTSFSWRCNDRVISYSGDNTERTSLVHGYGRRSKALDGQAQSGTGYGDHSGKKRR